MLSVKPALPLLFFFLVGRLVAQIPEDLRFDYLGTEQGLSHSSVSSIVQDPRGFIWLGTQEGLNRFDGETFLQYKNDPFDLNSLPHNLVQTIYQEDYSLWLGTYGGLSHLNIRTGEFQNYDHNLEDARSLSNDVVVSITRDQRGRLWVGTLEGLNRLITEDGGFEIYTNQDEDPHSLPNNSIRALYSDSRGRLWIGSYGGLSLYLPEEDSFQNYGTPLLPENYVMDIKPYPGGLLALAIWGSGIVLFNPENEDIEVIETSDNRLYKILVQEENIWAASYGGGLMHWSPNEGVSLLSSESNSTQPLSNDTVYSLHMEPSGVLWIGTNGGGINRIIPGWNRFRLWQSRASGANPGKINSLYQDNQGYIWASLYNNGVERYDTRGESLEIYQHNPEDSNTISNDIVNFIFQDSRDNIWLGTNQGLNRYLPEKNSFTSNHQSIGQVHNPESRIFYSMTEDHNHRLWIGSYNNGLSSYNLQTGELQIYTINSGSGLEDNLIKCLLVDRDGTLWVGTNYGIYRYLEEENSFESYFHNPLIRSGQSSNVVIDLFQDSKGDIWAGTHGGGLNRYNPQRDIFEWCGRDSCLEYDTVLSIEESEDQHLWVATRNSIIVFSPDHSLNQVIDQSNGLPSQDLSNGSLMDDQGNLYFGSPNGVIQIEDRPAMDETSRSMLNLTSFKVMGQEYSNAPSYGIENVELRHNENYLEFQFQELNSLQALSVGYSYMLEGYDTQWNNRGNRNYGSYTGLPPGRYTLRIRSHRNLNTEPLKEIDIAIRILPPPWRSMAALIIYGALALVLGVFIIGYILKKRNYLMSQFQEEHEAKEMLENQVSYQDRELNREKDQRRNLELNFQLALDYAPYPIMIFSQDGQVEMQNQLWTVQTGYSMEECPKIEDWTTRFIQSNGDPLSLKNMEEGEYWLEDRNNHRKLWEIQSSKLNKDSRGRELTIIIARDITDVREMEEKIMETERLSAVGQLAGGIAHDFNNQLLGIMGYAELLLDEMPNKESKDYLQYILEGAGKAADLTSKLLAFAGKGNSMKEKLNVEELLHNTLEIARRSMNKDVNISMEIKDKDLWILGNSQQLQNGLLNLLINSRDAMDGEGRIEIRCKRKRINERGKGLPEKIHPGEYLQIEIQDHGSGIDPELGNKIFEPFYSTKSKSKGTGMGLAALFGTIKNHQGLIYYKSILDVGTTFYLYLPLLIS